MSDYRPYNPSTDPARNKAGYLGGKNPGYPGQVGAYNNWLYTPMDRRPTPSTPQYTPAPGDFASVTYKPQAPAYGGVPFDYSSIIAQNSQNGINLGPQTTNPAAVPTATNPSGRPETSTPNGQMVAGNVTGLTPTVPSTGDATMQPGQNAMQRWQSASQQGGGIRPISDERRYFWATGGNKGGLIDARAPMADPTQNKGAVQPVTFNNSPSNWAPF